MDEGTLDPNLKEFLAWATVTLLNNQFGIETHTVFAGPWAFVVIGASSGIGRETALHYARRNAALVLASVAGKDVRDRLSYDAGIDFLTATEGGIAGLRVAWDLADLPGDEAVRLVLEPRSRTVDPDAFMDRARPHGTDDAYDDLVMGAGICMRVPLVSLRGMQVRAHASSEISAARRDP